MRTINRQLPNRILLASVIVCAAVAQDTNAQSLRERAKQSAGPLDLSIMVTRPQKSLQDVVAASDAVVYGIVKQPQSRLTRDEQYIVTDYEIEPMRVLFQKGSVRTTPGPVPPLIVTQFGGELALEGKRVSWHEAQFKELAAGERVVLFLQWNDDDKTYALVSGPYGVFAVEDGKVKPRSQLEDHRHESIESFLGDVAQLLAARQKRD